MQTNGCIAYCFYYYNCHCHRYAARPATCLPPPRPTAHPSLPSPQACSSRDVDIISLELSQKLPFRLKAQTLRPALEQGVFFEVGSCLLMAVRRRVLYCDVLYYNDRCTILWWTCRCGVYCVVLQCIVLH